MKILSFISLGSKGSTFESTLFDLSLQKFCKVNGHSYQNIDLEQVTVSDYIQYQQNDMTIQARVGKFVQQQVEKTAPDMILVPVGNNDRHNVFIPQTKGLVYVITRDYEFMKDGFLGLTNVLNSQFAVVLNSAQHKVFKSFNSGLNPVSISKMPPPLNEHMFFIDHEFVTTNEDLLSDVSFFGRFTPKRLDYLKHLKDSGIEVTAYGDGWYDAGYPVLSVQKTDRLDGVQVAQRRNATFQRHVLTRTKIGVVMTDTVKPVHFEIPACGALLVSNSGAGFFRKQGKLILPTFKTKESLLDVIKHMLENGAERKALAEEQRSLVLEKYSTAVFLKKLLRKCVKVYGDKTE